jgi:uncharacterized protein (DUF305 family)
MAFRFCRVPTSLIFVCAVAASGQSGTSGTAPIVQPGAPGAASKTLSPSAIYTAPRALEKADIEFMQGMIMHHSQAVEMTNLMPTHTHNKELLAFGKRIRISQSDEMKFMKQWLEERGQPVEMNMGHDMSHGTSNDMSHMDHAAMGHEMTHDMSRMNMAPKPMMMPGMLTPEQMKALANATGPRFDHLFLTGMIQHHGGALTMVKDLFDVPGTGQDAQLYDFVTDVDNTQRAEIGIMQGMLNKEKK